MASLNCIEVKETINAENLIASGRILNLITILFRYLIDFLFPNIGYFQTDAVKGDNCYFKFKTP